ncbi:AbrB/MazE/SpoVT family DNA-binding domain-containing protein [Nitrososphaera viennensis]|uniref:AbrB/MazE/SpoVT family DNA-binding domain-containing protein n=1 Tax=Nitrososphaera viennensis TaxID=1034015 RepID=A0A977IDW3_9ARCH|nr:AbrB/MazE/SpoVT family DNA-binding domain-containing protein [Nitrososphaera viennensis]UVS69100.1 AbrB/MazE/SpoVT family DNA-binding domain-containing protein [Nitrososphaera viennensis]
MPVKYTVTVTSVGSSSVIVVPKPVLEGFGLKKGDKVDLIVRDDGIYIPIAPQDKGIVEPTIKEDEVS